MYDELRALQAAFLFNSLQVLELWPMFKIQHYKNKMADNYQKHDMSPFKILYVSMSLKTNWTINYFSYIVLLGESRLFAHAARAGA